MSNSKIYELDLWGEKSLTVPTVQLDSDRIIRFKILADKESYDLTGKSVRYYIQKEDGKIIFNDCTVEEGIVKAKLTNQALYYSGTLTMQLQIYSPTGVEKTFLIYIYVSEALKIDKSVESSDEFTALENAIMNYQNVIATVGKFEDVMSTEVINPAKYKNADNTWSNAINIAITKSKVGDVILIPDCTINETIKCLEKRTYKGKGWGAKITVEANSNLQNAFEFPTGNWNTDIIIKDIKIDCGNSAQKGIYVQNLYNSIMQNVKVQYALGTGIHVDSMGGEIFANTNHFINCRCYYNGGYGIYLNGMDNHILGGDYGYNYAENVYFQSPSSSIRNAIVWGSRTQNGIFIHQGSPSVQILNNQIEGNAGCGIYVKSSHNFIQGNKIYDNANTPNNWGKFSGVYFDTTDFLTNNSVIGNKIFSGLYDGTAYHSYAISIGENHNYFTILNNDVKFQLNGKVRKYDLIKGTNDTDTYDICHNNSYCRVGLSSKQAIAGDYSLNLIQFNNIINDIESDFVKDTYSFNAQEKGDYLINLRLMMENVTAESGAFIEIHKNGVCASKFGGITSKIGGLASINCSDIISLDHNDKITINLISNTNVNILNDLTLTRLTVKRI